MRAQTQKTLKDFRQTQTLNVIKETRKMIKGMSEEQRFKKALQHVNDALEYKQPRPDAYGPNLAKSFKYTYKIQTSKYWTWLLFILSYLYMYTIILNPDVDYVAKITIETICLFVMWVDMAIYLYHKSFESIKISSKFEIRFYCKIIVVFLLTIDLLIYVGTNEQTLRAIRPFRILRGLLPIFYDALTRKNFYALISAYKDILAFVFLYACTISSVALIANQVIQLPPDMPTDQYTNNYNEFLKAIYVIYTLSSYDSYPDNQLVAVRWNIWTYALFIFFVFLNMFFFTVIPSTIILNSFRQTRSKTILIDQMRQQHSLILAFVSLGQDNYNIDTNTLIKFLLYMYRHKVRYVNYITEICLTLDQNNNGSIQISEFMQLCKILTKNSEKLPPEFDDWKPWLRFRQLVNQYIRLEDIVRSWQYRFVSTLLVLLTFINCIVFLATEQQPFETIDNVFMGIFVFDLVMRMVGLGPQNFFKDKWNDVDFFIVVVVLFLQCFSNDQIPHNSDILLKMARVFRIATFIKLIKHASNIKTAENEDSIYFKMRRLMGITAVILPIIFKIIPFFLITYYFLGVIGMEIFYNAEFIDKTSYGMYSQFSNFKTFLGTQFIFVQVLTEAGWSMVCFDYSKRTGVYFPIFLFFICLHVIIVIILAALLKGLIWEVYNAVQDEYQQKSYKQALQVQKQNKTMKKRQQFDEIKSIIQQNDFIVPNSVIKRQFLENKLDIEIFKRLKQLYARESVQRSIKKRTSFIEHIIHDKKKYIVEQFSESQQNSQSEITMNKLYSRIIKQNLKEDDLEIIEEEDFEEEMEDLMHKLILHPKMKYSETIVYPKVLLELLEAKMIKPFEIVCEKGFNINRVPFENKEGIMFHTYELNVLLEIERSQRDQKLLIIQNMTENNLITEQQARNLFSKNSSQRNHHIDVNWIIRKMFLNDTNEQLIQKFQIQYFSDIYGESFKEINKVTIQPLLRYEALLTYNLRNILRYPQIPNNNFFQMLTKIEDCMSNNLLKKGSLFKFVYQIKGLADNWFTVQFKESEQIKIHFIKTGIWIYNKSMEQNEIYFGKDLFKWDINDRPDKITCEKILKLLYQTFEGLAFGLLNQNEFFESNPVTHIYDIFSFFVDVERNQRQIERKLSIAKIMLVVLSKQQQRMDNQFLEYQISQIIGQKKQKKTVDFKFDETERQTFNKLKNLSALDQQRIVQNEGLPFAYVLNLMKQVRDVLTVYSSALVSQVQKILNQQFDNK